MKGCIRWGGGEVIGKEREVQTRKKRCDSIKRETPEKGGEERSSIEKENLEQQTSSESVNLRGAGGRGRRTRYDSIKNDATGRGGGERSSVEKARDSGEQDVERERNLQEREWVGGGRTGEVVVTSERSGRG